MYRFLNVLNSALYVIQRIQGSQLRTPFPPLLATLRLLSHLLSCDAFEELPFQCILYYIRLVYESSLVLYRGVVMRVVGVYCSIIAAMYNWLSTRILTRIVSSFEEKKSDGFDKETCTRVLSSLHFRIQSISLLCTQFTVHDACYG